MKVSVNRLATVMEYLQRGGELRIDGQVFVWLDDQVVKETDTHTYHIDGLARKLKQYSSSEKWEDPNAGADYFMGCGDMAIEHFFKMINDIPSTEMVRILRDLKEMRAETGYEYE